MSKPELYVSIDIETDGPAPGVNSMLAMGAAAFTQDGEMTGTHYSTMHPLEDAYQDTKTMDWWTTQPEAWAEVNRNQKKPALAMEHFVKWCDALADLNGAKLIAVGWPIAFDFAFVNYYCHRFMFRNPLGFAGVDIRSYANGMFSNPDYYGTSEEKIKAVGPAKRRDLRPHVAVDDAIEQGELFMALRAQFRKTGP